VFRRLKTCGHFSESKNYFQSPRTAGANPQPAHGTIGVRGA